MNRLLLIFFILIFLAPKITFSLEMQSKQEILADIPSPWDGAPLKNQFTVIEPSWNNSRIWVTVHGGTGLGQPSLASIYLLNEGKYKLLERIESFGYFSKPNFFWISPAGGNTRQQFVHLTEKDYGTAGHDRTELVFHVSPSGEISKVHFISASKSYLPQLGPDEEIRKGGKNTFSPEGLNFEFNIWKKDDANCCPTGNTVTGTYSITETIKGSRRYIISAKKYSS